MTDRWNLLHRLTQSGYKRLTVDQLDEIRVRLARRPPDAQLNAVEAAIYTGRSTRTLKRAIDAGVGPQREKNPDVSGLGSTNRHTHYRKSDLDHWREGLMTFDGAFRTFEDLLADEPWLIEDGVIAGHLLDLGEIDAAIASLDQELVIFLRLDEALQRPWATRELRQTYQKLFLEIVRGAADAATAAAELDAFEADTGKAAGKSKPPSRP
jgi:hypothetical protein